MKTDYKQIINGANIGRRSKINWNAILSLARQEEMEPARNDSIKRLLLCIDIQNDFMQGGALTVPRAEEDVERVTRFIYNNMHRITRIICSKDTHVKEQIFHPCWWINSIGENPNPYTVITTKSVALELWQPAYGDLEESISYLRKIEKDDKKKLRILPYYCICGTEGCELENEFNKMIFFHSIARHTNNSVVLKGIYQKSEMDGIIKSGYGSDKTNRQILRCIEKYDEVYVVGEAASHSVLKSLQQIAEYFSDRPEITKKITVLYDCTSPIMGFEEKTQSEFKRLNSLYGIKFAKSTDINF